MKIRCGFVSNSSTSCYIIRGASFKRSKLEKLFTKNEEEEEVELWDKFEEVGLDFYDDEYDGDTVIVGINVVSVDNGEISEIESNPEKLGKMDQKIREAFIKVGIDVNTKIRTLAKGTSMG